jgi:hypothetical protein
MQSLAAVSVKKIFREYVPNHNLVLILDQSWSIMSWHEVHSKNRQPRVIKLTPTSLELSRGLSLSLSLSLSFSSYHELSRGPQRELKADCNLRWSPLPIPTCIERRVIKSHTTITEHFQGEKLYQALAGNLNALTIPLRFYPTNILALFLSCHGVSTYPRKMLSESCKKLIIKMLLNLELERVRTEKSQEWAKYKAERYTSRNCTMIQTIFQWQFHGNSQEPYETLDTHRKSLHFVETFQLKTQNLKFCRRKPRVASRHWVSFLALIWTHKVK